MKFLFDQSADFRLIPYLQELGHDVSAIFRNYPHGLADKDVLAIAQQEQRILIVADHDFDELIFSKASLTLGSSSFDCQALPCKPKSNSSTGRWMNTLGCLRPVRLWW